MEELLGVGLDKEEFGVGLGLGEEELGVGLGVAVGRKKSLLSFLYLSSSSVYAHQAAASYAASGGAASARRKSVSVASAALASRTKERVFPLYFRQQVLLRSLWRVAGTTPSPYV
jgi:hypothetical protein